MTDQEKFEGMKRQAVEENEAAYGKELREKYGGAAVDEHAARMSGMTRQEWDETHQVEEAYKAALRRAAAAGDSAGADAKEAVRLHAEWLGHYWAKGAVTPEAHTGMAEMYVQDQRFTDYYEQVAPGCAAFFLEAVKAYYRA